MACTVVQAVVTRMRGSAMRSVRSQ